MMGVKLIDRLGEWNPQLLRELKGRLKPRNIFIAAAISIVGQILVYLRYKRLLPKMKGSTIAIVREVPRPQFLQATPLTTLPTIIVTSISKGI